MKKKCVASWETACGSIESHRPGKIAVWIPFLKTEKHRVWKISSGYLLQKHPDIVPLIKQSAAVLRLLISCVRQLLRHFFLWEKATGSFF